MRARFPIAIVISLATFACLGGPTSDTPSAGPTGASQQDAGTGLPPDDEEDAQSGFPGGGATLDAGSPTSVSDAASASELDAGRSCDPSVPIGDAGPGDGGVGEASIDAQLVAGDAAPDASDSSSDAQLAGDAEVEGGANFPDATGDAQPLLSDGSSDAPHMPSGDGACVP